MMSCNNAMTLRYKIAVQQSESGELDQALGTLQESLEMFQEFQDYYDGALISLHKAKIIYTRELGVKHTQTVQANASIDLCQKCVDQSNKDVHL